MFASVTARFRPQIEKFRGSVIGLMHTLEE